MKIGSLFSGAGLGDLGWMMAGFDIKWQVEIDEYCQKILELRFPETRKYRDIKTIKGTELEPVDIVAGGFPCQPFSVAGKQGGDQDDRNLWPEMLRVVKEVRPAWVVGENVSGIIPIYLDTVLSDLESEGYACRTFVFPAHALGACHRRERIWVVGYSEHNGWIASEKRKSVKKRNGDSKERSKSSGKLKRSSHRIKDVANSADAGTEGMRQRQESTNEAMANAGLLGSKVNEKQTTGIEQRCEDVADTESKRLEGQWEYKQNQESNRPSRKFNASSEQTFFRNYWKSEPGVGRVAHGMPNRIHRLKALGNGQVVACTAFIGQQIMEFERINQ